MLILSYENEISFTCKLNSFSYEWLCTRPRFEREASGNSEMVYLFFIVEEAGGKCLPCAVDIRDEGAVVEAVQKAVKTFGGIDILVNNASAISLTGTLETPMKR